MRTLALLAGLSAALMAQKYTGPKPDQPDLPYLKHADQLIALESNQAAEETRKDDVFAVTKGASSPVRTPLAEPYFLMEGAKLDPRSLELYKLETKGGQREVLLSRKRKPGSRPMKIMVNALGNRLYRIDVNETLENGEYCLSPQGSNQVFCFQVY
jgi:hypothetical protein